MQVGGREGSWLPPCQDHTGCYRKSCNEREKPQGVMPKPRLKTMDGWYGQWVLAADRGTSFSCFRPAQPPPFPRRTRFRRRHHRLPRCDSRVRFPSAVCTSTNERLMDDRISAITTVHRAMCHALAVSVTFSPFASPCLFLFLPDAILSVPLFFILRLARASSSSSKRFPHRGEPRPGKGGPSEVPMRELIADVTNEAIRRYVRKLGEQASEPHTGRLQPKQRSQGSSYRLRRIPTDPVVEVSQAQRCCTSTTMSDHKAPPSPAAPRCPLGFSGPPPAGHPSIPGFSDSSSNGRSSSSSNLGAGSAPAPSKLTLFLALLPKSVDPRKWTTHQVFFAEALFLVACLVLAVYMPRIKGATDGRNKARGESVKGKVD